MSKGTRTVEVSICDFCQREEGVQNCYRCAAGTMYTVAMRGTGVFLRQNASDGVTWTTTAMQPHDLHHHKDCCGRCAKVVGIIEEAIPAPPVGQFWVFSSWGISPPCPEGSIVCCEVCLPGLWDALRPLGFSKGSIHVQATKE